MYKLTLEPLTGIHIGTGEKLTPLDYHIIETSNKIKKYVKFSSDRILANLVQSSNKKQLDEFYNISKISKDEIDEMKRLRKFFQHKITSEVIDYPCDLTSEFFRLYEQNSKKSPLENAAEVIQMYRPAGSKTPVIPGSSIKGAIRTAILNDLLSATQEEEPESYDKYRQEYEKYKKEKKEFNPVLQGKLLNFSDPTNDPFRCVSFADATFPVRGSQLVGCLKNISVETNNSSYRKGQLKAIDKLQIQAEIIPGTLLSKNSLTATSILTLNPTLLSKIEEPITIDTLRGACRRFYASEFNLEYDKFYAEAFENEKFIKGLKAEIKKYNEKVEEPNTFIIRLGRWSQIEYVTFEENFRSPIHKNGAGGTRTVFNYRGQYAPMGWCKCTITEI